MLLRQIFDKKLAQYSYLVGCQRTGEALLIDPERDVDRYLGLAAEEGLRITAVTETHIHADFLSGARELAERLDLRLYLSDEGGAGWKYQWIAGRCRDDSAYDVLLLKDGSTFHIGNIEVQAIHTPRPHAGAPELAAPDSGRRRPAPCCNGPVIGYGWWTMSSAELSPGPLSSTKTSDTIKVPGT